jgi:hypothetical protein
MVVKRAKDSSGNPAGAIATRSYSITEIFAFRKEKTKVTSVAVPVSVALKSY